MISMNEIKTILKAEKRRILRELRDKSLFGAVMVFIDVIFDTIFSLLIPQFNEDGSPKGFIRATPLLCILSLATLLDRRLLAKPSVEGQLVRWQTTNSRDLCCIVYLSWTGCQEDTVRHTRPKQLCVLVLDDFRDHLIY